MSRKKTNEELKEIALKYTSYTDFIKSEASTYVIARKRKILNEICFHMKRSKIKNLKIEDIKQKALLCSGRGEFKLKYPSEYKAARRLKILNDMCSHMGYAHKSWTNKALHEEALKFDTRTEFAKKSNSAYLTASNRDILDNICSHMKDSRNSSIAEIDLLDSIKTFYPKAHKLKDMRVKIPKKLHIHGFEIDIYIPELRKGIEFDGIFYHSIKGLKRGRPKWPTEDLQNYLTIKDSYFASKGIQILHIKEEDWIKDKQSCIDRCLEFLEIKEEKAA